VDVCGHSRPSLRRAFVKHDSLPLEAVLGWASSCLCVALEDCTLLLPAICALEKEKGLLCYIFTLHLNLILSDPVVGV